MAYQTGLPICGMIFEPIISRIRDRNANQTQHLLIADVIPSIKETESVMGL
jgi:hypothetical protein